MNMKDFISAAPWWRTEVPTRIVLSENGVKDMLDRVRNNKKAPFFIVDGALVDQPQFAELFNQNNKFVFNATASEPRTGDVDYLVRLIKDKYAGTDVVIGVGGGGTMDLAKAVGICLTNPKTAAEYQGWGYDMNPAVDVWAVPTLAGTGAEITPIAVLRGPEKKLGINSPHAAAKVAIIDPALSTGVKKFNRFFTMVDCYCHHYEITLSKTSAKDAIADAYDGLALSREVLGSDLSAFDTERAIKSARASLLGGSSTIGGRVGASHAISYGLSNAAPTLPHSVAVTLSIMHLPQEYPEGHAELSKFMKLNSMKMPTAKEYGITGAQVDGMVKTAINMDKLWLSHFGDDWQKTVTPEWVRAVYERIIGG